MGVAPPGGHLAPGTGCSSTQGRQCWKQQGQATITVGVSDGSIRHMCSVCVWGGASSWHRGAQGARQELSCHSRLWDAIIANLPAACYPGTCCHMARGSCKKNDVPSSHLAVKSRPGPCSTLRAVMRQQCSRYSCRPATAAAVPPPWLGPAPGSRVALGVAGQPVPAEGATTPLAAPRALLLLPPATCAPAFWVLATPAPAAARAVEPGGPLDGGVCLVWLVSSAAVGLARGSAVLLSATCTVRCPKTPLACRPAPALGLAGTGTAAAALPSPEKPWKKDPDDRAAIAGGGRGTGLTMSAASAPASATAAGCFGQPTLITLPDPVAASTTRPPPVSAIGQQSAGSPGASYTTWPSWSSTRGW